MIDVVENGMLFLGYGVMCYEIYFWLVKKNFFFFYWLG